MDAHWLDFIWYSAKTQINYIFSPPHFRRAFTKQKIPMNLEPLTNTDCRFFKGNMPCSPHKKEGVKCGDCPYYSRYIERILIIKRAADGDVLRTTSILKSIKIKYPNSYIIWLTEPSAFPLLESNPLVDRIIADPTTYIPMLFVEKFDWVINPDTDYKSCLLATLANAKRKSGFILKDSGVPSSLSVEAEEWLQLGIWDDKKKKNRKTYQQIVHEICDLPYQQSRPLLYLTEDEIEWAQKRLLQLGWVKNSQKKVIGINTGAGKRWKRKALDISIQEKLIQAIQSEYGNEVDIFLLGGPEEKERNRYLKSIFGNHIVDTGTENNIREFAAIVHHCDVVITGDSLALHIGVALEKFVIVFFGPTSASEIELYGNGQKIISDLPCQCCYLSDCNVRPACNERDYVPEILNSLAHYLKANKGKI